MVEVIYKKSFSKGIIKIKDKKTKEIVKKKLKEIKENPELKGQFLIGRKLEKKIYIKGYRLLYSYDKRTNTLYFIDFDRRDKIYKK